MLTGATRYYYRAARLARVEDADRLPADEDFEPLAVDAASNSLYALKPLNGRKALYRIKLDGICRANLVASNPSVDIDDVVRSATARK